MIFRQKYLDGIADGAITLAFRRWVRPTVKTNGTLRTGIGVVRIGEVSRVARVSITEHEARAAGYDTLAALLADLDQRNDGELYRIGVSLEGPDPRVALRENSRLSVSEIDELTHRLDRLDARARSPWTRRVLALIAAHPGERASGLAQAVGQETLDFKRDVRKLKELGLTESLVIGYRVSPRGEALLRAETASERRTPAYTPKERS